MFLIRFCANPLIVLCRRTTCTPTRHPYLLSHNTLNHLSMPVKISRKLFATCNVCMLLIRCWSILLFTQDLSRLGRDLDKVVIVDNSPASYIFHPDNAVSTYITLFIAGYRGIIWKRHINITSISRHTILSIICRFPWKFPVPYSRHKTSGMTSMPPSYEL